MGGMAKNNVANKKQNGGGQQNLQQKLQQEMAQENADDAKMNPQQKQLKQKYDAAWKLYKQAHDSKLSSLYHMIEKPCILTRRTSNDTATPHPRANCSPARSPG